MTIKPFSKLFFFNEVTTTEGEKEGAGINLR